MSLDELLIIFENQNISFFAEGESIRCRAPKGILTKEILDAISEHKKSLLLMVKKDDENPVQDSIRNTINNSSHLFSDNNDVINCQSNLLESIKKEGSDTRDTLGRTPPRNATDEILIDIWKEVLEIEQIGINDNFFELGGNSIFAAQVTSIVEEIFDVDTEFVVRGMFSDPTISGFSDLLIKCESTPGKTEVIARIHQQVNNMSEDEIRYALKEKQVMNN